MADPARSGRRSHGTVRVQRQRCTHRAQAARHRRRRLLRRHHCAHRPLGSQPGPDRQARRRDRHRRLGRAVDPRDRADCQRAHGVSAHTDLVFPEIRCAAAHTGALGFAPARRESTSAADQPGLRRGDLSPSGAVLHGVPAGQVDGVGRARLSAPAGPGSGGAQATHPAVRDRLQAARASTTATCRPTTATTCGW